MNGTVLVVGDGPELASVATVLVDAGAQVLRTGDVDDAVVRLGEGGWDIAIADIAAETSNGIELLDQRRDAWRHTALIVVAPPENVDAAIAALDRGAEAYLTVPIRDAELGAVVRRALGRVRLARDAENMRAQLAGPQHIEGLIGDHPAMQDVFRAIAHVARTRATVLVSGETGTGKELVAAAIHYQSPRKERPFVRVNCAALAETILESELFGHERGAFTGAAVQREGRFEVADGGTLFLDEVSEIPLPLQIKLLRFLQERTFERVGGNETIRVDVRVVAATNKNLRRMADEGRFREDLYYRLHVVEIEVPPLRVRPSDIPALAEHFLRKHSAENGIEVEGFEPSAVDALVRYPWPGNVRELENVVERAVVMCHDGAVRIAQLPAHEPTVPQDVGMFVPGLTMAEIERIAIQKTYEATGRSTQKTAELLGISRRKVQYKLKEWNGDSPSD